MCVRVCVRACVCVGVWETESAESCLVIRVQTGQQPDFVVGLEVLLTDKASDKGKVRRERESPERETEK